MAALLGAIYHAVYNILDSAICQFGTAISEASGQDFGVYVFPYPISPMMPEGFKKDSSSQHRVMQLGSRLEFGNLPYSHFVGGSLRSAAGVYH